MKYERATISALICSILGSVIFASGFVFNAPTWEFGLGIALAAGGLCAGLAVWSFTQIPQREVIDEREPFERPELESLGRPVVVGWLLAAFSALGIAALFPLRSLGPSPGNTLFTTKWSRGIRIVRDDGTPVLRDDLNVDAMITAFPEGSVGDAASQVVLLRVRPGELPQAPDGYLAFSKVCTHAGCPVALYLADQRQLMCPCHQSLFDVLDHGKVLSGPADRPLPQLPIAIDPGGELRAERGFSQPVGPGFWEDA